MTASASTPVPARSAAPSRWTLSLSAPGDGPPARWITGTLALLLVLAAGLAMWAGRGSSFTADEWGYLLGSVHATPSTVIGPVAGHLTALLILAYHALFTTVGLGHSWPYRAVSVATHLVCCALLFVYARRRVGDLGGLLATIPILFLGTAADTFITLHQAAPVGALTAGLGALIAFDQRRTRTDVLACALFVLAVAGDTEGMLLTAAIAIEIVLVPGGRRRLWIPAVPLALFAAWWIGEGPLNHEGIAATSSPGRVLSRLGHMANTAASAVAGLFGVQLSSGTITRHVPGARILAHVLLAAVVLAGVWRVIRRGLTPRVLTFALTAVAYWAVLALARESASSSYANRYVFVGALLLVLIAVELLAGAELRGRWLAVAGALLVVCTLGNIGWLFVDGHFKAREGGLVRAELAALQLDRGVVPPNFQPDANIRLSDVRAAQYFAAVDKYHSSPAEPLSTLAVAPLPDRVAADGVLVRGLPIVLVPGVTLRIPTAGPPVAEVVRSGTTATAGRCLAVVPHGRAADADLRLRPGGALIRLAPGGEAVVTVRRFAPFPRSPLGTVRPPGARLLAPVGTSAAVPWRARVVMTATTQFCP